MTNEEPPDLQNGLNITDAQSALHGSIKGKKDLSYYYAHAPRDTKEAPAAMPVHTPIAKESYTPGERTSVIKTFQFLDDKEFAKVYLPMEGLQNITSENITSSFESTSFSVTIRGLKSAVQQFTVAKLHKEINPDECVVKIMKTKILIKLKKVPEGGDQEENQDNLESASKVTEVSTREDHAGISTDTSAEPEPEEPDQPSAEAAESGMETEVGEPAIDVEGTVVDRQGADVSTEEGTKRKEKKEPRYPHWYSLRA